MSRLYSWRTLLLLVTVGCANATTPPPPDDATAFVSDVKVTTIDGGMLADPLIVANNTEQLLRLEFTPRESLPEQLDERTVLPAKDWDLQLWVGEQAETGGPQGMGGVYSYRDRSPGSVQGQYTAVSSSGGGVSLTMTEPAAPARRESGREYRYIRLPVTIAPGRHSAKLLAFPAADPPPAEGLMVGAKTLGTAVLLAEFQVEVGAAAAE